MVAMPSARQARPIIVEVSPSSSRYNMAPSSPLPSPSSLSSSPAKGVRFSNTPAETSRPLTSLESWSAYHFESHARQCADCKNPLEVFRRGGRLCDAGHGLAQDVSYHVHHLNGEIYSTAKDAGNSLVRVEIPANYVQLRSLLQALDLSIRSRRTVPIVSYDRTYAIPVRKAYDDNDYDFESGAATLEPARSKSHRKPKQRHAYDTVEVRDDRRRDDFAVRPVDLPKERRGTLYEKDMQRKKEAYRVEIREPSDVRQRREERRRSSIWY